MTAEKNRKAIMRGITALLVLSAITLGCAISARSCVKTALGAADAVKALKKTGTPAVSAEASPKVFTDFEVLYQNHGGLGPLPLLNLAEAELEKVRPAFAAFQKEVRNPEDTRANLEKAKSAVWRSLGEGSDGRLLVPGLGVDIALKKISIMSSDQDLQNTVDLPGNGAWIIESGWAENVIADHRSQGFGGLLLAQPGTEAFVCLPTGTILELSCVSVENGLNDGVLRHPDGTVLAMTEPWVLYTCRQDSGHIRISAWEKVREHIVEVD